MISDGPRALACCSRVLARSDAVLHRTTRPCAPSARPRGTRVHARVSVRREAVELPNGCTYAKVSDGSGPVPKRGDVVAVRLRGLLESGAVFLDSFNEGGPILFELGSVSAPRVDGRVTPGVDAAVAQMRAGEVGRHQPMTRATARPEQSAPALKHTQDTRASCKPATLRRARAGAYVHAC